VLRTWRFPAALAAIVGISFPTAAAAAGGSGGLAEAVNSKPVVLGLLKRPGARLQRTIDVQVREIRSAQRRDAFASLPAGVSQATLDAIGACESGGDPTAVSADGSYRGKYQFDYGTWASVGGSGDPAAAPEAEQDYRAALLYARSGSSPWPICGQ
jgi:hypothetical protein